MAVELFYITTENLKSKAFNQKILISLMHEEERERPFEFNKQNTTHN